MNKLAFIICIFLVAIFTPAYVNGQFTLSSVFYDGREILKAQIISSDGVQDPDSAFAVFLAMASRRPFLKATEHFDQSMGVMDGSNWLTISANEDLELDGKLELYVGGVGRVWISQLRLKKIVRKNHPGTDGWIIDDNALFEARKKIFVSGRYVSIVREAGLNIEQNPEVAEKTGIQRYSVFLLLNGFEKVFEGSFESELKDPDQLWMHCKQQILRKKIRFNEKIDLSSRLKIDHDASKQELVFDANNMGVLRLHVEGLGISTLGKTVLSPRSARNFRFVESIDWGKKADWSIRRNMVQHLKNQGRIKLFKAYSSHDGKYLNFRIIQKGLGIVLKSAVFSFDETNQVLEKVYEFPDAGPHGPYSAGVLTNDGRFVIDIHPYVQGDDKQDFKYIRVFDVQENKANSFSVKEFLTEKELEQLPRISKGSPWRPSKRRSRWFHWILLDSKVGKVYLRINPEIVPMGYGLLDLKQMELKRIDEMSPELVTALTDNRSIEVSWTSDDESLENAKTFPLKVNRVSKGKTIAYVFNSTFKKYVAEKPVDDGTKIFGDGQRQNFEEHE